MSSMKLRFTKLLAFLCLLALVLSSACSRLSSSRVQPSASPSPTPKPIVDQILDHYTEAVGGKEATEAVKSYRMKGTFEIPALRITGSLETWGKEPHKTLVLIRFPRFGALKKGFDGETHWVQSPQAVISESGPQAMSELERDADVYNAGRIRSLYETIKLESKGRLGGRDVYILEGKPAKGPPEKLLFDIENGLLLRWDMARKQPGRGIVFVKVSLGDYRDVSGVKVPFNVRFNFESFELRIKVDEMQHNVELDDSMFMQPK